MKGDKSAGEYRKELYAYLEKEGLEITPERHDQIRYLVKMAAAVSNEDKAEQIGRLSNKLVLYKEKYGELSSSKKEKKHNDPKYTPHPDSKKEPAGNGGQSDWHSPRSFG